MIIVSACLLGENCKYSGGNNKSENVIKYLEDKEYILVCPEQLGGLSTPRNPSEIITYGNKDGNDVLSGCTKVLSNKGIDVTSNFIKGLLIVNKYIIMPEQSPIKMYPLISPLLNLNITNNRIAPVIIQKTKSSMQVMKSDVLKLLRAILKTSNIKPIIIPVIVNIKRLYIWLYILCAIISVPTLI